MSNNNSDSRSKVAFASAAEHPSKSQIHAALLVDDPAASGQGSPRGCTSELCVRMLQKELEDLRSGMLWKAVLAEFLGCFFLVYFGVGSGLSNPATEAPAGLVENTLAAGFFITAILTALTTASGAHVNPAVSLGFLVARQCSCVRFFFYVLAQCVGAIAGAGLLKLVTPAEKVGGLGLLLPAPDVTPEQALMAEFMITFFLLFVIIASVDKGRTDVAGSIPFIVGLVVCVNIFYAHNISGAAMNPIRNLGPAVVLGKMKLQWIYWVGPMLGGAAGALLYDRIFSVSMTTTNMRRLCLSRGSYEGVNTEADTGAESALEAKPQKPISQSATSLERIEAL